MCTFFASKMCSFVFRENIAVLSGNIWEICALNKDQCSSSAYYSWADKGHNISWTFTNMRQNNCLAFRENCCTFSEILSLNKSVARL